MGERQGPMDLAKLLETNAQAAPHNMFAIDTGERPWSSGAPDHLGDKSPLHPTGPFLWGCKIRYLGRARR